MPNSFTTRHKGENVFNLFSTELSIHDVGNLPIFLHEFYHHIQNTSTILGAERFNYFIQSLAHIAKLAGKTDTFYLPLDKWIQQEDLMTTTASKQLLEIYEHKLMWDYLEKKNNIVTLPYDQFVDKDKSVTVISLDYFGDEEWLPTPILVMKETDEFKGYVIGGFFVAESGAFGLEQFHCQTPYSMSQLLIEPKWYPYHCLQVELSKHISNPRLVHLAAFLVSDLAMIVSTPSMGLIYVLGYVNQLNNNMQADNLIDWYTDVFNELKEDIIAAFELQKKQLRRTKSELKNSDGILSQTIMWHIDTIISGLEFRLKNPSYYVKTLTTDFSQERFKEMMSINPVNKIQVGFEKPFFSSQKAFDSYNILSGLMDFYLSIKQKSFPLLPDEIVEKYDLPMNNYALNYRDIDLKSDSFVVHAIQDDSAKTDLNGYLLRWLGLDGKKIQYLSV